MAAKVVTLSYKTYSVIFVLPDFENRNNTNFLVSVLVKNAPKCQLSIRTHGLLVCAKHIPFSSNSQHLSYDVCLEVRGEIIRTVLCCIVY